MSSSGCVTNGKELAQPSNAVEGDYVNPNEEDNVSCSQGAPNIRVQIPGARPVVICSDIDPTKQKYVLGKV